MRFSKSKLNTYLACPRKYYLHYELGMRALKTPKTLVEGSAIHHIVESGLVYGDRISDVAEEASRAFWSEHPFDQCVYESEEDYLNAQELCLFQSKKFLEELGPLPASRMEVELHSDLINPVTGETRSGITLIGYLDLILTGQGGEPFLVDLKTVGRSPREGMARVALELSFYAYLYAQPFEAQEFQQFPVALIYLIRTKQPKVHWDESVRSLPHFVELFDTCAKVAEHIRHGCFWKNPGMRCSWCDQQSLCYLNEEAAIETFGEEQWNLYLLDQSNREESLIGMAEAANF
jgi:CRISPR/Cas system-associated exonuclease Cas4 (RecB family)